MWKPTIRHAAILATAIIGIALVALWRFNLPTGPVLDRELAFSYGSSARVLARGGRYMDVTVYKFNDNREVSWIFESHLSRSAAELELQELLKGDVEIIERSPVFTHQEERVGERVVALSYINGRASLPHAFLWKSHGGVVYRVEGTSLDHVFAVERSLK